MPTIQDYREKQAYIKKANEVEVQHGIPHNLLVGLLKTESNLNPKAKSSAGAKGIAQFLSVTAKEYGINPYNPMESIEAAGKYLANSYKKLGNWENSLRAYNMGLQGVLDYKAGKRKLPKETAEYTGKVYKNAKISQPTQYATPIADEAIRKANAYFEYAPTIDVKDLYISENSDNLADNSEEKIAEEPKDKDIQEVEQQTREYNFLQEYQNLINQEQIPQEQVVQEMPQPQIPQQNLEDIYNQVSEFVDSPTIAQQGGNYYAQTGGVIKDQEGQRKFPNQITEIQGNKMSTEGYGNIPLYVIPDTGNPQIIQPNTGEYEFPGATKFTEYPLTNNEQKFLKYIAKTR